MIKSLSHKRFRTSPGGVVAGAAACCIDQSLRFRLLCSAGSHDKALPLGPRRGSGIRPQTLAFSLALIVGLLPCSLLHAAAQDATTAPAPPSGLTAKDHPWDGGDEIDLVWKPSPDDVPEAEEKRVLYYRVERASERIGVYRDASIVVPTERDYRREEIRFTYDDIEKGEPYFFRVVAVGPDGVVSSYDATSEPTVAVRQLLDGGRGYLALIILLICGSVIYWIWHARKGRPLKLRKIAGLEAVDEAVGRATETGRPCLFVPGVMDMNDIQTIAGMTVLSRVAKTAAEYDAKVEVPTGRSLVMTAARETVQAAFLEAGRPDAYNEELIYYVTDEQFGYVAYLSGLMVREEPAACFYMGSFYAESLILAETGNSIGAIQVAGTAMPAQLPFFVAACDYTLIGEEFFAASAYLSGEADQLGSLKGQDVGKILVGGLLVVGCLLATLDGLFDSVAVRDALDYLTERILK